MDQLSFASLEYATKKKRTKREAFLAEMAAVVPWAKLEAVIEPHYPKSGPRGGRLPFPLPVMLRIYCLPRRHCIVTCPPVADSAPYLTALVTSSCIVIDVDGRDGWPDTRPLR